MAIKGFSQEVGFKGQLSSWLVTKPFDEFRSQLGGRYIPELSYGHTFKEKYTLDAEASANIWGTINFYNKDSIEYDGNIDLFRLWLRFYTSNLEIRAGLQKITFGTAQIFRPLMWFDEIDPRDPLGLTNGVYGVLGKYFFKNNANIWLWVLYGNDDPKGWEVIPSAGNRPEIGGRVQFPFISGELAFSYHHRYANLSDSLLALLPIENGIVPENRFGIDGKWDVGVGLWFEGSFNHQDIEIPEIRSSKSIAGGVDYTIGIGSGLHVMGEQFWYSVSEKMFEKGETLNFTALTFNYPISIIDNLTYMFYYDWTNNDFYNFINWGMTWDKISLYIIGYWNPDTFQVFQNVRGDQSLYAGKGFQVLFVFNH
jgi:hypothetical protein